MKKWIILILLILLTSINASAEYFRDVIINTSGGIWTDSRAYSSLNLAIASIGSAERDLYVAQEEVVTSLTIPENVRLHFLRSGAIANSGQLTINTKSIEAGNQQIFTGAGDIDFVVGSTVKSSWFSSASEAINITNDDQLTLVISDSSFINEDCTVGNNVTLKWESPRNRLTISAGFTMSNIKNIEAGNYQLFAGAGDFDFLDGTVLNLSWFARLRSATTWIEDEEVTIEVRDPSTVDYDTTVSRNTTLKFAGSGAILTISAGKTLTVNGPWVCGQHQSIAGTGIIVFGGGAVDYIYPQWWGGSDIADGTTESAAAINSALTTANNSTNGGIVYLPAGVYNVSSTLYIMTGTILQGAGISSTTVKSNDAISIIAYDPTSDNDTVAGTFVKDLTVDGLDTANGGYGFEIVTYDNGALIGSGSTRASGIENVNILRCERGLSFEGAQGFVIKSVKFGSWISGADHGNTYGIYLDVNDPVTNAVSQQVTLQDCDFRFNDYGIYETYTAGSKAYGWLFLMCHFECNTYGIVADNALRWTFINCKFEQNDDYAVSLTTCEYTLFEGCYFNNNSDVVNGPQVYLDGGFATPTSIATTFKRCDFLGGSSSYDIELNYVKNLILEQCHHYDGNDRIDLNDNSTYRIVDIHETEQSDPMVSDQKILSTWVTFADSGTPKIAGVIPHPYSAGSSYIYVEQVLIHVTEAFDLGGGSYTLVRVGDNISDQRFSQSQDVTATGIKTPVMNNEGYFEPGTYFKVSVVSDGVPTQGKALAVIRYYEVPQEP